MLFKAKKAIENKITPLAKSIPLSPNMITFTSILSMFLAGYFVIKLEFVLAGIFVFVSGFLDILDGAVAKAKKKATKFGSFFDKFADRVNDIVILSSVIIANVVDIYLGLFALVAIVLASYASAVIESITKTKIGSVMSLRGVRILVLTIGLISNRPFIMMIIVAILGLLALGERLVTAMRMIRG